MNRSQRRNDMNRRKFLQRSALMGGVVLGGPAFLAACGSDEEGGSSGGSSSDPNALFFDNWPEYIDGETVDLFTAESGLDFTYGEGFNDNNEYFAKIQPALSKGNTIGPDLLAPTSWMAARLISLGWVDEMPIDKLENLDNLEDSLRNPSWDPDGKYTMPWQSGMAGIAYNIAVTGRELTSTEDLFDPAFKGKIGMLTEMRDTMGLLMLATGADPSKPTFDGAAAAFEKLEKAKADGVIRSFTGNDYIDDLASGNFAANIGWSGDVKQIEADNPDVRFVIPEEGGTRWADTMVVPKGSPHADNIAKWIDYCYDPVNAARIAAEIQYISPVKGIRDILAADPDTAELAESELLFPSEETLANLYGFGSLSEEEEAKFDAKFSEIVGS